MHPDAWKKPECGPCRFLVRVAGAIVCDVTIDVRNDPEAWRWFWFNAPVAASDSGVQQVELETEGVGGLAYRWAVWRNPVFMWLELPANRGGKEAFKPKAAAGYDYYVPGQTIGLT